MNKAQIIWLIVMICFIGLTMSMELSIFKTIIGFVLSVLVWVVFDNIFMNVF